MELNRHLNGRECRMGGSNSVCAVEEGRKRIIMLDNGTQPTQVLG